MEFIFKTIFIGIVATIVIDLWATFSNRVLNFPRTNWAMVGRWLGNIPSGRLIHVSISSAPEVMRENLLGWVFHYFIGVVYAFIYICIIVLLMKSEPTILSAWLFGIVTILSPWLIMQPSLGMGICASKAPNPNMVRLQNFAIHSIFGLTLYYVWVWSDYA